MSDKVIQSEISALPKAYAEYMKLSDILRNRGYDVEADAAEKDAEEVKSKTV